jgi:hypothetical protein
MSRLSEIVSYRRSQGSSVTGALAGGIKERLKEKFDPRQLINQRGLLAALFPGLKTYQAKTGSNPRISGKSIEKSSVDVSDIKPIFENIQSDTRITAKNLSVLPSIHRDFNVIRQNIVKLLKLEKFDAATKADMYFKAAAKREEMYESQLSNLRNNNSPERQITKPNSGSFNFGVLVDAAFFAGLLGMVTLAIKGVYNAVERIRNIDLKESIDDFLKSVQKSIDEVMSIDFFTDASDIEREMSRLTFGTLTEDQKKKFLEAQAKAEGFGVKGTKPTELNNPGAMLYNEKDESQKKLGAKPSEKHFLNVNGKKIPFAQFPTVEAGKQAQREKWESPMYKSKPLNEAARIWSGTVGVDTKASQNYLKLLFDSLGIGTPIGGFVKKPAGPRTIKDVNVEGFKMKEVTGDFGIYGQMSKVENVVLHHTGDNRLTSALNEFERFQTDKEGKSKGYKHGVQYVIDRDGTVYNIAPDKSIMYHAGTKSGVTNQNSIGVEIVSKNSESFTEAQTKSAKALVAFLRKRHGDLNVVGHGEISPDKMKSEGRALAEEIRKNPPVFSPQSMGNMGEMIDNSSFNVAFGSMNEDTPIVFINNNTNQQNVIVMENQSESKDYLPNLFRSIIA